MPFANILLLLAAKKMLSQGPTAAEEEQKRAEFNMASESTRLDPNRRMAEHDQLLQYFVKNHSGSDTGPTQERQEAADPFLSMFMTALSQQS